MAALKLKTSTVLGWGLSALLLLSSVPMQASASPVFSFSLEGNAAAEPTSVLSYSVNGSELMVLKLVDGFSNDLFQAVASGTIFATGQLTQYEGLVSPESLVKTLDFSSLLASGFSPGSGTLATETVSFMFGDLTVTAGPASVPEPGTIWLIVASTALLAALQLKRR